MNKTPTSELRPTMKLCRNEHPKPHAKYAVIRGDCVFTATPCYGMHEPWWVVRLMPNNEADPVCMQPGDAWMELGEFLTWKPKIECLKGD